MVTTNLSDITAASHDFDLIQRVRSAAAERGISDPTGWADQNMSRIVSVKINEEGDTLASVYAYAKATYTPTPPLGANPAAVTDDYIRTALGVTHPTA